jgi:hypothetical protein
MKHLYLVACVMTLLSAFCAHPGSGATSGIEFRRVADKGNPSAKCDPETLQIDRVTKCTARLTQERPSEHVVFEWTTDRDGSFNETSCFGKGRETAYCSVFYTPKAEGAHLITATVTSATAASYEGRSAQTRVTATPSA